MSEAGFARGGEHKKKLKQNRRLNELASVIQQALESIIIVDNYSFGSGIISLHLNLLQSDGSILAVAFNAAALAMMDAGIPLRDFPVALSGAFLVSSTTTATTTNPSYIVDCNLIEENARVPLVTLAILPRTQELILCQVFCYCE